MENEFDHGFPPNPYNPHAWIIGKPEIGDRVWIGAFCLIDAGHAPLKIGRGTDISSGVQILTHTTLRRCISERSFPEIEASPTEIGEFCFVGTHATILRGAKISHHSVIGAGCVVPENMEIPPYSLVVGVPAKIVGSSKKFLKGIMPNGISIVLPAYNEEKSLVEVIKDAKTNTSKLFKNYEVLIVDDGSTDKTPKLADVLSKKDKKIKVIHHKVNRGFSGVMKTGLYSAKFDLVFLAPSDGQFKFDELKNFVEAIRGYDVAVGFRKERKEGLIRSLNSWVFHFICRNLLGIKIKQFSSVFLWRKNVLDSIKVSSPDKSAMFLPEFFSKATKMKYKFVEVQHTWLNRRSGVPKGANPLVILITLREIFKLWLKTK
ncbi:glycosyltransferase [Candidatus Woesebacteria bacterium]|nr:glycosyltransferase [Candidatus Woesebacteria bacterium]